MDTPETCRDGLTEMMKNYSHNNLHVRPRSDLVAIHIDIPEELQWLYFMVHGTMKLMASDGIHKSQCA
jgi:hypothetical protein